MQLGSKIKRLRIKYGLTQEELAARTELSKGFISQLERDLTSPSIATLVDILEALGTNLRDFFNETTEEKVVFNSDDIFVKVNDETGVEVRWLITNAQKNALEPILITIPGGKRSEPDDPHEGEEFGYVLSGSATLWIGSQHYRLKKGSSFYYKPSSTHYLENTAKSETRILWVSTPPSF